MEILIASTNSFKVNNLRQAWEAAGLDKMAKLVTFEDLDIKNNLVVDEDTGSIIGDAKKKAEAYASFYKRAVISTDQGFGFNSLDGWPGAMTKNVMAGSEDRILGNFNDDIKVQLGDVERAKLVLSKLSHSNRKMKCFYSVAISVQGKACVVGIHEISGTASREVQTGVGWFYDWFFIPVGFDKTLSQFSESEYSAFLKDKMYRIPIEVVNFISNIN